jgi:hypothetical protein
MEARRGRRALAEMPDRAALDDPGGDAWDVLAVGRRRLPDGDDVGAQRDIIVNAHFEPEPDGPGRHVVEQPAAAEQIDLEIVRRGEAQLAEAKQARVVGAREIRIEVPLQFDAANDAGSEVGIVPDHRTEPVAIDTAGREEVLVIRSRHADQRAGIKAIEVAGRTHVGRNLRRVEVSRKRLRRRARADHGPNRGRCHCQIDLHVAPTPPSLRRPHCDR